MSLNHWQTYWQSKKPSAFEVAAWDYFIANGFPAERSESWSNFSSQAFNKPWKMSDQAGAIHPQSIPGFESIHIVNGRLAHSNLKTWKVSTSQETIHFSDGLEALTVALAKSHVRLEATSSAPLLIYRAQNQTEEFQPYLLSVNVPAQVKASVLNWTVGVANSSESVLTKVDVGAGSELEWVILTEGQRSCLTRENFHLAEKSNLRWAGVQLDSDWSRLVCEVELAGEASGALLRGLCFGRGNQQVDSRWLLWHRSPNTVSEQIFKSVVRDRAKNVFTGKIKIDDAAQLSDASQKHYGLIFNKTADCITQPELEVQADNVKAAHGAAIGRLNEEELFYLASRGINRQDALKIMAKAFIKTVYDHLLNRQLVEWIDQHLDRNLEAFLKLLEADND